MVSVTFSVGWSPPAQAHPLKGKVTMFGIFKRKPAEQQLKLKSLRNAIGTGGY